MSKQRAHYSPASDQGQPSPRLMRGLALGWAVVVIMVIACTFLAMDWGLRPGEGILLATGVPQFGGPDTVRTPSSLTSAAPVLTSPVVTSSVLPTTFPNQDRSFGYGIQGRFQPDPNQALDRVIELGLGWVKVEVDWALIEQEPGQPVWASLDAIIRGASTRNLRVLVTVVSAPDWSRSVTARDANGPPDDVQLYVSFVSQVVQRYRGAIHALEIWEQQNIDEGWYTAGGLNPSGYMALLVPTAQIVRQLDPGILIVSGALTPTGRNDGVTAVDDFIYMQAMIDAGLLDLVDCVGARHTGFNLPPDLSAEDAFSGGMPDGTFFAGPYDYSNPVNPHHSWSFYSTLNGYHSMIVAAGRDNPLCVTRFGWASATRISAPQAGYEFAHDNTLREQAEYVVQAFQSMSESGFVRLAILYNLDYSLSLSDAERGTVDLFSLLDALNVPRPAFEAVLAMDKTP